MKILKLISNLLFATFFSCFLIGPAAVAWHTSVKFDPTDKCYPHPLDLGCQFQLTERLALPTQVVTSILITWAVSGCLGIFCEVIMNSVKFNKKEKTNQHPSFNP